MEQELSELLLNAAMEAASHAIEREWPLVAEHVGHKPITLPLKVSVWITDRGTGKAHVAPFTWLYGDKIKTENFPEFEVGDKQMTIDFGEKKPATAMQAAAAKPLLEGIEDKLMPLLRAAEDMGRPLFVPCMHEDVPPGIRFDSWDNCKCSACSPLPESKMTECLAAMENGGIRLQKYGPSELRLSLASSRALTQFGYEVWEQCTRGEDRWRLLGTDDWVERKMTFEDGRVPFNIFF